jgi:hypothetical protein
VAAQTIATCNGYEMVEDGPRIYFLDRATSGFTIALFVLGLITAIAGVNGVVWALSRQLLLGAILLGAAGAFAGIFTLVLRARRRRGSRAWNEVGALAFIDRQTGAAHDGAGQAVAPLGHVAFAPVFQLGSSSKALALKHPGGSIVIARGSPFGGSIDDFIDVLRARGLTVH